MGYASGGTVGRNGVGRAPVTLLVHDLRLFCEALLAALGAALNVHRVEIAATLSEALERLRRRPAPDLAAVRPEAGGRRRARQADRARAGRAGAGGHLRVRALRGSCGRLGAARWLGGYPEAQSRLIVEATAGAWRGERQGGSGDFPRPQAVPDRGDAAEALKALTPQQARILELVCEGKFNKQIAHELDICEGTVKAHLSAILRKLNVRNRTQAVLLAQNAGFAPTSS